jgi:hypothetical protein
MKKIFKLILFLLALSIVPALCHANTIILTSTSPNHTVTSGNNEKIYGTSVSNQIVLERGARAELLNFSGYNTVQFQSSAEGFTVSRFGSVVIFQGTDGTSLKIPATVSEQLISFNDKSLALVIHQNQIMLGIQEIVNIPELIKAGGNNHPPSAVINTPQDLSVYVFGDPIHLSGMGFDFEDGELGNSALVWTSNLDGKIGMGASVAISSLSVGTHLITLIVSDSAGAINYTKTQIRVSNSRIESYCSAESSKESGLYLVEVLINDQWINAHAYQYTRLSIDSNWHGGYYPWVHWATIGISENTKASIRVTRRSRPWGNDPFTSVELQPSRYNIAPSWNSDFITFEMEQNQKVYVKINNQDHDTLFIFANPLKPPVPENAKYFGPGVHNIGADYELMPDEKDVYLDGGAWVIGSLDITGVQAEKVRILGPGVLSGEFEVWENLKELPWEDTFPYMMIHTDLGISPDFDVMITGITIVGSPFYNLSFYSLVNSKRVDNIHILSPWTGNTDGLNLANRAHVTNTFVFNNDDTILAEYLYDGNIFVSDCVLAGRNPFLIGYGYFGSGSPFHATIKNCDLILQESREPFRAQVDGKSSDIIVDNQTYENIHIDGNVQRLVYLSIEDTEWGASNPAQGNITEIIFKNITVTGNQSLKSVIRGKDTNNRIDNILFEDLVIGGIKITNNNYNSYFDIDWNTVDVVFRSTD